MADKTIIALRRKKYGRCMVNHRFLPILIIIDIFLARKLCHKTGGRMLAPKIAKTR
jgi:hypothetical protein